jgi:hypothetical protein
VVPGYFFNTNAAVRIHRRVVAMASTTQIAKNAWGHFASEKAKGNFDRETELVNFSSVPCTLVVDKDDDCLSVKRAGIEHALRVLRAKSFSWPKGIIFYLSPKITTVAFHRGADGESATAIVMLGGSINRHSGGLAGIANKVAPVGGVEFAKAVVIHELGHNLHARSNPDMVLSGSDLEKNYKMTNASEKVSPYATKNPLEFVAEVFTGLVYGYRYDGEVMSKYEEWGGPQVG